MFSDLELPISALLVIAFIAVKMVLARAYSANKQELSRPQRTAEEETAFLEAQAEVQRKIAAQRSPTGHIFQETSTVVKALKEDLAALQPSLGSSALRQSIPETKPLLTASARPVLPLGKKNALQKAFVASLIFSKPKALKDSTEAAWL